jgi:hypothetical protein
MKVDFPDPDGPIIATSSSDQIRVVTSRSACTTTDPTR